MMMIMVWKHPEKQRSSWKHCLCERLNMCWCVWPRDTQLSATGSLFCRKGCVVCEGGRRVLMSDVQRPIVSEEDTITPCLTHSRERQHLSGKHTLWENHPLAPRVHIPYWSASSHSATHTHAHAHTHTHTVSNWRRAVWLKGIQTENTKPTQPQHKNQGEMTK